MEEKFSLIKTMVLKSILGSDLCGLISCGVLRLLILVSSHAINVCTLYQKGRSKKKLKYK